MAYTGNQGDQKVGERLRRIVRDVAREEDLRLVVLFGSGAREAESPEDLDLGVLGRTPVDLLHLTNRLIERLERQDVDLVDLGRADPVLMVQVARDGTPLYEESPGEFARFHSLAYRRFADTRKFREAERRELEEFIARRDVSG